MEVCTILNLFVCLLKHVPEERLSLFSHFNKCKKNVLFIHLFVSYLALGVCHCVLTQLPAFICLLHVFLRLVSSDGEYSPPGVLQYKYGEDPNI